MADSRARRPRGLVSLNGQNLQNWLSLEVNQNAFYCADTFDVRFKADAMNTPAVLAKTKPLLFEIFAGEPDGDTFTPRDLTSLILGEADELVYDPISRVFCATGRDLTAPFIDNKTIERWQDRSASDIATALATRRGLTPVVTKTDGRAGKQYLFNEYARLTDERSEWDILTWLAHENAFVVYVKGRQLYFGPPQDDPDPYQLVITPADLVTTGADQAPAKTIKLHRNLTVAKGVTVTVLSQSIKYGNVKQSFPRSARGARPGQATAPTQNYYIIRPELSADAAFKLAESTHKEISQHELKLSADFPGDVTLNVSRQIQLRGSGTDFDQMYFPDSVTFNMDFEEGFRMAIEAKNVSAENTVAV